MLDVIKLKYYHNSPIKKVLDHGFVELIDCMPRMIRDNEDTADHAIAEAARCSYQRGTKTINDDKILIRYLMRHNHTSPFEMIEFKFHCKMPVFIARQWIRHRTANVNELSGRYSELPNEFYIPENDNIRCQSSVNRQGSDGNIGNEQSEEIIKEMKDVCDNCFESYKYQLESGVVREQARMVLPLNTYTEWYWKIDLKNLLHFLNLRCDHHAQWEIQQYGNAILDLIRPIIPWTIEAWEDYSSYRGGMMLTKLEVEKIRSIIDNIPNIYDVPLGEEKELFEEINATSKIEQGEWTEKAHKLGLIPYDGKTENGK